MSDPVLIAIITAAGGILSQLIAKSESKKTASDDGGVGTRPTGGAARSQTVARHWRQTGAALLVASLGLFSYELFVPQLQSPSTPSGVPVTAAPNMPSLPDWLVGCRTWEGILVRDGGVPPGSPSECWPVKLRLPELLKDRELASFTFDGRCGPPRITGRTEQFAISGLSANGFELRFDDPNQLTTTGDRHPVRYLVHVRIDANSHTLAVTMEIEVERENSSPAILHCSA